MPPAAQAGSGFGSALSRWSDLILPVGIIASVLVIMVPMPDVEREPRCPRPARDVALRGKRLAGAMLLLALAAAGWAVWQADKPTSSLPSRSDSRDRPFINDDRPPSEEPEGMVWIPGGQFWMGGEPQFAHGGLGERDTAEGGHVALRPPADQTGGRADHRFGYIHARPFARRGRKYPGADLMAARKEATPPGRAG